jgi:hypothetical protein
MNLMDLRAESSLLAEDDVSGAPMVAILTDDLWHRRFGGDPGIVERTVTIDAAQVQVDGWMRQSSPTRI